MSVLEVQGLTKRYPAFVLEPLTFSLEPGTITGLIGRNGAGKTTALRGIWGFLHPDGGSVRFFGKEMAADAPGVKQQVGFVSGGMTAYKTKKLAAITRITKSFYPNWDEEAYARYCKLFALEEQKTPAALSEGMKVKYALALALSHGAQLLLLDEPTSGLDPVSRGELLEIFLTLCDEGKTILFSTHITSDLDACAHRILYLREGKLAADEPLTEFVGRYRLVRGSEPLPPAQEALLLGKRRTREGFSALVRAGDAPKLPLPVECPDLEAIMLHL